MREEGAAQPHPDDWPEDISEPEFLELTQVYNGEERRDHSDAPDHAEPDSGHPVPGDELQPFYISDESPDEVVFAPEMSGEEPAHAAHAPQDFAHAPQDFIADEPVSSAQPHPAELYLAEPADPGEAAEHHPEAIHPAEPVLEHDSMDVRADPSAPHPASLADATPTLDDFEQAYPVETARQGRIVLDKPEKRALFLGGLVGMAIVALAMFLIETV